MMKAGDEQWVLLPRNDGGVNEGTNLAGGTFYVLVVGQGQNVTNYCPSLPGSGHGDGQSGYSLSSGIEPVTILPDALSYTNDLVFTNSQQGGEAKFYQFNVPHGIASIEVRLENRVGNPLMTLNGGGDLVRMFQFDGNGTFDPYGSYGGIAIPNNQWRYSNLITIPNPRQAFTVFRSTRRAFPAIILMQVISCGCVRRLFLWSI
jgi:hypothetical protein